MILFVISTYLVLLIAAVIFANIRHKSYKNNPNIEKAKGVYIVFSVFIYLICQTIISFNYDAFTDDSFENGVIPGSSVIKILIFLCVLIFILISLSIKAIRKKKTLLTSLFTISVFLPILIYKVNYYLVILKPYL